MHSSPLDDTPPTPELTWHAVPLDLAVMVHTLPGLDHPLAPAVREVPLLHKAPWVRTLGKLGLSVTTQGWRFPTPEDAQPPLSKKALAQGPQLHQPDPEPTGAASAKVLGEKTRLQPPNDLVVFKDRLLYLLQPPLEDLFAGKRVELPFQPYPYQIKGIAFLMPRHSALLADEMGLGKTAQVIIALRLLFHAGLIQRALVVCPKPLVINWTRELKTWADDVPYEVIGGDTKTRQAQWLASKCPVKLVNYELLTRDADLLATGDCGVGCRSGDEEGRQAGGLHHKGAIHFDVVVLDEAQRIKNRESKTAKAARAISRDRSWAMTGTPIENRVEDLINIFAFVDEGRIPPDVPAKLLPELTRDSILRRVKEEVATDMPPKVIRDSYLELTPAQRETYDRAEKDGIVHLGELGETITVQHVFELVMRLKQICNFDPRTGDSAKLEQMQADLAEIADSGRKAIVFSQWVEPLETLARALQSFRPLLYHGKVPQRERQPILDHFKKDPKSQLLLMSYGTGSVGLNLQFCNYVFLFDRWWNPAVEDQAINRAHRLGQKESVFVTRFVAQGTIEERIAEILEKKRRLFEEMLGQNGPPTAQGLSEEDIFGLFNVKKSRRAAA